MRIPQLAHYLIETMTLSLHWVSVLARVRHAVRSLATGPPAIATERTLRREAREGTLIAHQFSHDELARMVGATRPWVTIAIKHLKNDAVIACSGRHVIVRDKQALKRVIHAQASRG